VIQAIEILLTLVMTLLLFSLGRSGHHRQPLSGTLRRLVLDSSYRTPLLWGVAVFLLSSVQTHFDGTLTRFLGYDLTAWVHRIEGDRAAAIQSMASPALTYLLVFFYIVMFPVMVAAPMLLAASLENAAAFRAMARGLLINYAVCLPFYLLFPVKEMWAGNPERVRLLVDQVSPAIMEAYRATSALDNCFPSFHTSLSVTFALLALRLKRARFAAAMAVSAAAIVFSTLYLGIHWLTDAAAGAVLGAVAAWAGGRRAPDPRPAVRRSPPQEQPLRVH
jgi:membrane-associated phospholipid phosphatase